MNSSLPSYDLHRLFHYSPPTTKESAGEALIEESLFTEAPLDRGTIMTDSLDTVAWED